MCIVRVVQTIMLLCLSLNFRQKTTTQPLTIYIISPLPKPSRPQHIGYKDCVYIIEQCAMFKPHASLILRQVHKHQPSPRHLENLKKDTKVTPHHVNDTTNPLLSVTTFILLYKVPHVVDTSKGVTLTQYSQPLK